MKKGFIKVSRKIFGIKSPKEPRKVFSKEVQQQVRRIQRGRCAHCKKWEHNRYCHYDHIRGRSDNSITNCQMLCLKCHNDKTWQDRIKSKIAKRNTQRNKAKKR